MKFRFRLFMAVLPALVLTTACEDLIEKNLASAQVPVIAPVDKASVTEGAVTFLWRAVEGATAYQLTIVAPSFDLAGQVVTDSLVAGVKYTVLLTAGSYQWSIAPVNSAYSGPEARYTLTVTEPADTDPSKSEPEPEPKPKPESAASATTGPILQP